VFNRIEGLWTLIQLCRVKDFVEKIREWREMKLNCSFWWINDVMTRKFGPWQYIYI
jgi:hypothetical protein